MSKNETDDDYAVGYKRPPREHRFRPGNKASKGRPRNSKNYRTLLEEALDAKVPLNDRQTGRRRTISKRKAAFLQLANKAANGDLKAVTLVLNWIREIEARPETRPAEAMSEADEAVLANIIARLRPSLSDAEPSSPALKTQQSGGAAPATTSGAVHPSETDVQSSAQECSSSGFDPHQSSHTQAKTTRLAEE